MILAIDVDGVLANFNEGYRKLFIETTGRDTFRGETDPPCWHYHRHYGYTDEECRAVWAAIEASPTFWRHLSPLPGAVGFLRWLFWRKGNAEVYFITSRPGATAKVQTEEWLRMNGFPSPTVLIARGSKGDLAAGLGVTDILDDRPENLLVMPAGVRRYLRVARYNVWAALGEGIRPVERLEDFVKEIAA